MNTKSFVAILLLTFLLGLVTGFFVHKDYFIKVTVKETESQINKAEIIRQDSLDKNARIFQDSLKSILKQLRELENEN